MKETPHPDADQCICGHARGMHSDLLYGSPVCRQCGCSEFSHTAKFTEYAKLTHGPVKP